MSRPISSFAAAAGIVVLLLAFVLIRIAPRGPLFITAATIDLRHDGAPARPGDRELHLARGLGLRHRGDPLGRDADLVRGADRCSARVLFPYGLNLPLQLWPRF